MVRTFTTPESQEARCPACGAAIKVGHRSRVQCPKCREVVTIKPAPEARVPKPAPPAAAVGDDPDRIAALELRIAALEQMVKAPFAAAPAVPVPSSDAPAARPAPRKPGPAVPAGLRWLTGEDAQLLDITPAQEEALLHNLATIAGQAITIRTISGNAFVRKRAECLKAIFGRAGWTVHGVEEIPRANAEPGLSLAVGTLPVEKEAAAAYLALKAAGLAIVPVLDPALATFAEDEPAQLSLTVAPMKAGQPSPRLAKAHSRRCSMASWLPK